MTVSELIMRGASLKAQIDALKKQLEHVNDQIAAQAVFGKTATAYVSGEGCPVQARVVLRTTEKWDQDKLNAARVKLGDNVFLPLFRFKWEARKKDVDAFLTYAPQEQSACIRDALTTSTATSVTYVEKKEAAA